MGPRQIVMKGYGKIIALNGAMAVVQLGYAVVGFLGSNFLVGPLQFNETLMTVVNVIGPVSGLIVQPMVGAMSDVCHSRMGRRRPFIFAGSLMTILAYVCYFVATFKMPLAASRTLGICALLLLNIGLNTILGPYRALTQEALTPELIDTGNAFASTVLGFIFLLLNFAFFLLCHFLWKGDVDSAEIAASPVFLQIFKYTTLVACVLSALFTIPLFWVSEVPFDRDSTGLLEESRKHNPVADVFVEMWRGLRSMPRGMLMLWIAFLICWAGFFPYQMFLTAPGCLGLYLGALVTGITSISSFIFSFLIPKLSGKTGQGLWFAAQIAITASFFAYVFDVDLSEVRSVGVFFQQHWWIALCAVIVGINQASMNSIPFAMIGKGIASPMANGVACSILNVALVAGQGVALLFQTIFFQFLDTFRTPFIVCLLFSALCILMVGIIDTRGMHTYERVNSVSDLGDRDV